LPEELTQYFTEKPLYVDGSFIPMTRDETPVREASRAEFGLPEDAFVMAALGNSYKITPEMFGSWMRLLQRIPNALLWLIDDNEVGTRNLRAQAVQMGVSEERLFFMGRTTHVQFCARLKLADIYLDTYPYNCGSTSNDVIAAGLPLVTRYGKTMVSRMGLSLLTSVHRAETACQTLAEYEDKVLELYLKNKAGIAPARYPAVQAMPVDSVLGPLDSNVRILFVTALNRSDSYPYMTAFGFIKFSMENINNAFILSVGSIGSVLWVNR
jgi:predicted O-linked N-acetylglucosamine transferase (SPINDLY family)